MTLAVSQNFPLAPNWRRKLGLFDIFSTSTKAVDTATGIIDGAVSGIDKLIFTEQERAEFSQKSAEFKVSSMEKAMNVWLEVQKSISSESSIRSITRRMIAVAFVSVYLILIIAASIVSSFDSDASLRLFNIVSEMGTPVMTIIVFYFGYYAVGNIIKANKG